MAQQTTNQLCHDTLFLFFRCLCSSLGSGVQESQRHSIHPGRIIRFLTKMERDSGLKGPKRLATTWMDCRDFHGQFQNLLAHFTVSLAASFISSFIWLKTGSLQKSVQQFSTSGSRITICHWWFIHLWLFWIEGEASSHHRSPPLTLGPPRAFGSPSVFWGQNWKHI